MKRTQTDVIREIEDEDNGTVSIIEGIILLGSCL